MESVMSAQVDERQWYLSVEERSLGPLSTELVARGIRSGKVPPTAWVCEVGASEWLALSTVAEFCEALTNPSGADGSAVLADRMGSTLHEPLGEETSHVELKRRLVSNVEPSMQSDGRVMLPYEQSDGRLAPEAVHAVVSHDGNGQNLPSTSAPTGHKAPRHRVSRHDEGGIDITFDEEHESLPDFCARFQSYFLVGANVQLPDEERLMASMAQTPRSAFLHDEALWNLSLCLAFGSEKVAHASAWVVNEAIASHHETSHAEERLRWLCRTLLSKGFMPSGIPRMEGRRAVEILRTVLPEPHVAVIDREASS